MNFINAVKDVLEELGKNTNDLFENNIIAKNTFYKYKQRNPSLGTLKNIANYLKVSIDYIYKFCDENNYKPYTKQNNFYNNLKSLVNAKNISFRKLCGDLHFSRANVLRWKNGTEPSVQCVMDVAKYFNCTMDDLIL